MRNTTQVRYSVRESKRAVLALELNMWRSEDREHRRAGAREDSRAPPDSSVVGLADGLLRAGYRHRAANHPLGWRGRLKRSRGDLRIHSLASAMPRAPDQEPATSSHDDCRGSEDPPLP